MTDGLTAARPELPAAARDRRDPFAPLHENALAALLRDPAHPGSASVAVPTGAHRCRSPGTPTGGTGSTWAPATTWAWPVIRG